MNKLTVKESRELSLKKAQKWLDVTGKILPPRNKIAVVDDSCMELLWAWADEMNIEEERLPRNLLAN
jgi:hypothetical protein